MHPIRTFFKALLVALASAWLMFFVGVFLTLLTLMILAQVTSTRPDMTIAYRIVGLTAGCTAVVLGFAGSIIYDLRKASAVSPGS